MPTLTIHITTRSKKLTLGKPCILLSYLPEGDHGGSLDRMLNHRGVDHQRLLQRDATAEEMEAESHPYRYHLIPYIDWEKLVADERKYTDCAEWFAELEQLRKRFPQFEPVQVTITPVPMPMNQQPTLF